MFSAVSDIYEFDKSKEAKNVFGDDDRAHPAVTYLHDSVQNRYVGGSLQAINAPSHYDYINLRCKLACC